MKNEKLLANIAFFTAYALAVAGVAAAGYFWMAAKDEAKAPALDTTAEPIRIEAPVDTTEAAETEALIEDIYMSLGEYTLTAYCACEKCCGVWATNRPLDKDGNPIVYTASMAVAKEGVTVAADTDILPFGSVIMIDGHEYTVQDRGSGINGRHIDIYFESHEAAKAFGVQKAEVLYKTEVTE